MVGSTPSLTEINPADIPFQLQVIKDVRKNYDYTDGMVHELLLSGSVGSAKSLLGAHLVITHCLMFEDAVALLGRKSMPSLKDTILKKVLDHMGTDVSYKFNKQRGIIEFENGSIIIPYSWADGNYEKVRSLELSCALIEELTENDTLDFYHEIFMRVGRLSHINENWICSLTNPGSPSSPHYKYFIYPGGPNRHIYYSLTTDNKFLPKGYVKGLLQSLDPKMAERMVYGRWVDVVTEVIYHQYKKEFNYRDYSYQVNERYPIILTWDFNIGKGKPLSMALIQNIGGVFHIFNQVVVHGMRTEDSCEELVARGLLNYKTMYLIDGDATGKHRDTRSKLDDWEIIDNFMSNIELESGRRLRHRMIVRRSNPRIRQRHNIVNGLLCNSLGERRLFVYKDAPHAHEGLSFSKLRKGANFQEDDSYEAQHISTAIGYALCNQIEMAAHRDDAVMIER